MAAKNIDTSQPVNYGPLTQHSFKLSSAGPVDPLNLSSVKGTHVANPTYNTELDDVPLQINSGKTAELMLLTSGRPKYPVLADTQWGNWRSINSIYHVDKSVLLNPDTRKLEFSYTNKFEDGIQKLENNGLVKKVTSAADLISTLKNGGNDVHMSIYKNSPAWVDSSPIQVKGSVTFNFNFGSAGLYSGFEEVVKPIIIIASYFTPTIKADNTITGPGPSEQQYLKALMEEINGLMPWNKSNDKSEPSEEESAGANNVLSTLGGKIYGLIDNAAKSALESGCKCLSLRIGQFVTPTMIPKEISWSFDLTQIDEYGWPYKGSLTLSGIEGIRMVSAKDITSILEFTDKDFSTAAYSTDTDSASKSS